MRKHPILLILVIVTVAIGWTFMICLMMMSRHQKHEREHPDLVKCQIQVDMTEQSIRDRQNEIDRYLGLINSGMLTENQVEDWTKVLYGEWYKTIYPACKDWTDAQWDEYRIRYDQRRDKARGKEWDIDNGGLGNDEGIYKHHEPLYVTLSRDRQYLAKWQALLKEAPVVATNEVPPP